jgi:hypothetical protein
LLAGALLGVAMSAAAAQGWTDLLFGGSTAAPHARTPPPAYADPGRGASDPLDFFRSQRQRGSSRRVVAYGGGSTGYCVRLCDGRYFPVQRAGDAKPDAMCSAFCPASKTKVFFGSSIEHARASDGKRYEALDNAYEYRKRIVPDCTCKEGDALGLAPLDAETDPTLRPGDIVATKEGLMAYSTSRSRRGRETADFTPVDESRLPRSLRDKLSDLSVRQN